MVVDVWPQWTGQAFEVVAVGSGQSQNALATIYLVVALVRRLLDVFSLPVTDQVVARISWLRGESNALSFLYFPTGCMKTQTPLVSWDHPSKGPGTGSGPLGLAWHLAPGQPGGQFHVGRVQASLCPWPNSPES